MTMLASLASAYARMEQRGEVPPFGYSLQNIAFVIRLKEDGSLAGPPADLRDVSGKKPVPKRMAVPQPAKRTSGTASNFLWDKTSYVLGITSGEGKRLVDEHSEFIRRHREALTGTEDAGLVALLRFLDAWTPDQFQTFGWPDEMKDQNVVFALESERLDGIWLHDRPAARALWARLCAESDKTEAVCLVSGEYAPVARLHPSIKGVWGAQPMGASIVAFNQESFESYGHIQGENAPVSEVAAAAYTGALNKFLETGSRNRVQIGDASTVFWADASNAEAEEAAQTTEALVYAWLYEPPNDGVQAQKVGAILEKIRNGQRLEDFEPGLAEGVRFHVLGLAPNAARLSIRFWFEDDFGQLAKNYQRFLDDMRIEPPWHRNPSPPLWQYLRETAVLGKRENVPPNLAGEWMRSILVGANYPWTLLSNVLMRIRADGEINALRVSILKALLNRNSIQFRGKTPVALDSENTNKGYLLGRLFAVYEQVQTAALGRNVNATIKDKFYGSASAQPRKVFALLDKGSATHLSKVGKQSPGYRASLEKQIAEIMGVMSPSDDPFPASLSAEQQALFALGYYHQRSEFFKSKNAPKLEEAAT